MCVDLPCGYSSQTLAKWIAYTDIVIAVTSFVSFICLWEIISGDFPHAVDSLFSPAAVAHYSRQYKCMWTNRGWLHFLVISVSILYTIGTFILALILLHASQRRNHKTLRRWRTNSKFLFVVRIFILLTWIVSSPVDGKVGPTFIGFVSTFYNGVTISMVGALITHIEDEGVTLYARKKYRFD